MSGSHSSNLNITHHDPNTNNQARSIPPPPSSTSAQPTYSRTSSGESEQSKDSIATPSAWPAAPAYPSSLPPLPAYPPFPTDSTTAEHSARARSRQLSPAPGMPTLRSSEHHRHSHQPSPATSHIRAPTASPRMRSPTRDRAVYDEFAEMLGLGDEEYEHERRQREVQQQQQPRYQRDESPLRRSQHARQASEQQPPVIEQRTRSRTRAQARPPANAVEDWFGSVSNTAPFSLTFPDERSRLSRHLIPRELRSFI